VESLQIRPAAPDDAAAIARVHVDTWRTAYRGLMPAAFLAQLSYEKRAAFWRETLAGGGPNAAESVQVAVAGGEVVGFVSVGPARASFREPVDGELFALYLLEAHQGRGAGRALFEAGRRALAAAGYARFALWVLTGNGALGFYERLGGRLVGEATAEFGGATLPKVALAWDLAPRASQAATAQK
jgi:ribosomal protein S18 acetylase RimI-like enzyme